MEARQEVLLPHQRLNKVDSRQAMDTNRLVAAHQLLRIQRMGHMLHRRMGSKVKAILVDMAMLRINSSSSSSSLTRAADTLHRRLNSSSKDMEDIQRVVRLLLEGAGTTDHRGD